jgi:hypothetical protein
MRPALSFMALLSLFFAGCIPPLPYPGRRLQTPATHFMVVDTAGHPLTNYDLYVYRCTNPGSQASRVFFFPGQTQSDFYLPGKSKLAIKLLGGAWLAPDFYESYEPQPYWVAGVNKRGYRSRRWGWNADTEDIVTIVLEKSADPGPDYCDGSVGDCNPCRSHEYFMYQVMRYQDCGQPNAPVGPYSPNHHP